MTARLPEWRVRAWVTAPGEFPSRSLETVQIKCRLAEGAIARAKQELSQTGLDPVVVSVERTHPPALQNLSDPKETT